jgi:RNA-binding protein
MPTLDSTTRRALRARAHHLHPVVTIGQHGLTPAVLREIDLALTAHELIKIRVFGDDRSVRATLLDAICTAAEAAPVQHLGKLLVIWRPNPEKKPAAAKKAAAGGRAEARKRSKPAAGAAPRGQASDRRRAKSLPGRSRPPAPPAAPAPAGSSRRPRGEAAPRNAPPAGVPRAALPRRRRARG